MKRNSEVAGNVCPARPIAAVTAAGVSPVEGNRGGSRVSDSSADFLAAPPGPGLMKIGVGDGRLTRIGITPILHRSDACVRVPIGDPLSCANDLKPSPPPISRR